MTTRHQYLRKANDNLVSHCKCERAHALISPPGQLDCPWCGCGWLFICSTCRKAFTFAEGIVLNEPWADTARREIHAAYGREPEPGEVDEWVDGMKVLLSQVERGKLYVYFDGYIIPVTADGIDIEGWYARHHLDFVPQIEATSDPQAFDGLLCSREYWQSDRIERPDD
jgi:hypothetical protein